MIEFDSVEQAKAAHDSPAYQEALAALGNAAVRDIRIVEGVISWCRERHTAICIP